jgi:hypothetical protein
MFGLLGIVVGIILLALGIFLVFFFPNVTEHQPTSMGWTGIVLGFIFIVIGGILLFVW